MAQTSRLRSAVVAAVLAACSDRMPRPELTAQPTSALVAVPFPPPPARVELIPPIAPVEGVVWIDGEWVWRGARWVWTAGRWVVPPPGVRFAPWTSTRDASGALYYARGAWRDAAGRETPPPPPIAVARTRGDPTWSTDAGAP